MYTLKKGVSIFMSPEIEKILGVVCLNYRAYGVPVVITSGVDGPHRENSLHYNFRAIDIRKNFRYSHAAANWEIHREMILDDIKQNFKKDKFPVIIIEEQDHIHLEWCAQ